MESILRAAVMYIVVLGLLRLAGRRTVAQLTAFDLVLLLIISEAAQNGLVGDDFSITNSVLIIATLIAFDIGMSYVKERFPRAERWIDGLPVILVENGQPIEDRMRWARVDEHDVLEAARENQGLERFDQIKYAVLERSGRISIIPWRSGG